jgi:hypothetical protein
MSLRTYETHTAGVGDRNDRLQEVLRLGTLHRRNASASTSAGDVLERVIAQAEAFWRQVTTPGARALARVIIDGSMKKIELLWRGYTDNTVYVSIQNKGDKDKPTEYVESFHTSANDALSRISGYILHGVGSVTSVRVDNYDDPVVPLYP